MAQISTCIGLQMKQPQRQFQLNPSQLSLRLVLKFSMTYVFFGGPTRSHVPLRFLGRWQGPITRLYRDLTRFWHVTAARASFDIFTRSCWFLTRLLTFCHFSLHNECESLKLKNYVYNKHRLSYPLAAIKTNCNLQQPPITGHLGVPKRGSNEAASCSALAAVSPFFSPGCHCSNFSLSVTSRARVRVCSMRCAPGFDHRIC